MASNTAPTGAELDTLAQEAEHVQARIATKKGDIVFRFFPHEARQHSAAFIKLARAGFYDGLNFHRVEPKFVIQGGCPQGTGTGGPGYNLDAEFNSKPHLKGAVAMARSSSPNSAGSQFYICLDDARFLDKQYTVFGETVAGQDVVDKIRVGDVMEKVTIEEVPSTSKALPGVMEPNDWQRVLSYPTSLDRAELTYRERMKRDHPDVGGSQADAAVLNAAIESARKHYGK